MKRTIVSVAIAAVVILILASHIYWIASGCSISNVLLYLALNAGILHLTYKTFK